MVLSFRRSRGPNPAAPKFPVRSQQRFAGRGAESSEYFEDNALRWRVNARRPAHDASRAAAAKGIRLARFLRSIGSSAPQNSTQKTACMRGFIADNLLGRAFCDELSSGIAAFGAKVDD